MRMQEAGWKVKVRSSQLVQLVEHLSRFATDHGVMDAPVVTCGDLNCDMIQRIRGIARSVFHTAAEHQKVHPFLWTSDTTPSGPTTITMVNYHAIDTGLAMRLI